MSAVIDVEPRPWVPAFAGTTKGREVDGAK